MTSTIPDPRLAATQRAFDSVAADYDGPRGNNELIQQMRSEMWHWLAVHFPAPARLVDIGCGTGLDAAYLAAQGHRVVATDWSGGMVRRTHARALLAGLDDRIEARQLGAQELDQLPGDGSFDGAYSNLGPLNCVPDLEAVSRECARLLKPGGRLVLTVIGRFCPWELAYYTAIGRWRRAAIRFARGTVAVGMNGQTIWTRYYTPASFYRHYRAQFSLVHHRALCLFAPPPYMSGVGARWPRLHAGLWALDRRVAGWPLLRGAGDHFLIVMQRRT